MRVHLQYGRKCIQTLRLDSSEVRVYAWQGWRSNDPRPVITKGGPLKFCERAEELPLGLRCLAFTKRLCMGTLVAAFATHASGRLSRHLKLVGEFLRGCLPAKIYSTNVATASSSSGLAVSTPRRWTRSPQSLLLRSSPALSVTH